MGNNCNLNLSVKERLTSIKKRGGLSIQDWLEMGKQKILE